MSPDKWNYFLTYKICWISTGGSGYLTCLSALSRNAGSWDQTSSFVNQDWQTQSAVSLKPHSWWYKVLSCCSPKATRRFQHDYWRGKQPDHRLVSMMIHLNVPSSTNTKSLKLIPSFRGVWTKSAGCICRKQQLMHPFSPCAVHH